MLNSKDWEFRGINLDKDDIEAELNSFDKYHAWVLDFMKTKSADKTSNVHFPDYYGAGFKRGMRWALDKLKDKGELNV